MRATNNPPAGPRPTGAARHTPSPATAAIARAGAPARRLPRLAAAALAALLAGGCANVVRFPAELPSQEEFVFTQHTWLWGLVGDKGFEVYDYCPQGRAYEVSTRTTMGWGLVAALGGIYVRREVKIVCSGRVVDPAFGMGAGAEGAAARPPASKRPAPAAPASPRRAAPPPPPEPMMMEEGADAPPEADSAPRRSRVLGRY